MLKKYFSILSIFFALMFIVSCSKDDTTNPSINESEVLVNYLESVESPYGKDFINTDLPALVTADVVKTGVEAGTAYVIDIRAAADFALGHIKGAKNVAFADVLSHVKGLSATYDKIVICCYSGQTAAYATSLLRLAGIKNAYSLKWGMSSWNADFAKKWNDAVANGNLYISQFVSTDTPKGVKGALPTLTTGKKVGKDIFDVRLQAVITEGFSPAATITAATVFGNLSNYYIVNYWPANHYADPGHIPGAMQYTPKETLKFTTDLKTLPTNKTIVVYCYSGQTSAFITAYLRLLGYDAKTLLSGTNGMIYDKMAQNGTMNASMWVTGNIKGYDYEK